MSNVVQVMTVNRNIKIGQLIRKLMNCQTLQVGQHRESLMTRISGSKCEELMDDF